MKQLLRVGPGGFVGAVARNEVGSLVFHRTVESFFLMRRGESYSARSVSVKIAAGRDRFDERHGARLGCLDQPQVYRQTTSAQKMLRLVETTQPRSFSCDFAAAWIGFNRMGGDHAA